MRAGGGARGARVRTESSARVLRGDRPRARRSLDWRVGSRWQPTGAQPATNDEPRNPAPGSAHRLHLLLERPTRRPLRQVCKTQRRRQLPIVCLSVCVCVCVGV